MSLQHAQQMIAELYDYETSQWSTAESAYARHYLEHLTEGRSHPEKKKRLSLKPEVRRQLRDRIDAELAR